MKKGELLLLTSGAYSNYSPHAVVRILKDFKTKDVLELYLKEHPEQREKHNGEVSQFIAWLSANGYVEDVNHTEWNVGCYSTLEPLDD
jgi:hypothetical protein